MTKRYRKRRQYKNRGEHMMHDEYRDVPDDGYEYLKPKRKLRRNEIDGVLGGVCAGLGDFFKLDPVIVRIVFVASVIFLGFPFLFYFLLWICIPADKRAPYVREYRQTRRTRWKNPGRPASTTTFRDVKGKFRSLEERLQDLEKSITSSEWQLRRKFRDFEN